MSILSPAQRILTPLSRPRLPLVRLAIATRLPCHRFFSRNTPTRQNPPPSSSSSSSSNRDRSPPPRPSLQLFALLLSGAVSLSLVLAVGFHHHAAATPTLGDAPPPCPETAPGASSASASASDTRGPSLLRFRLSDVGAHDAKSPRPRVMHADKVYDAHGSQPESHAATWNVRRNLANAWHRLNVYSKPPDAPTGEEGPDDPYEGWENI